MEKKVYLTTNVIVERNGSRIILPKGSAAIIGKDITEDQAKGFLAGGEATDQPAAIPVIAPDKAELVKKLTAAQAEINTLTAALKTATDQTSDLTAENEVLNQQLDDAEKRIEELTATVASITMEAEDLKIAIEKAQDAKANKK